MEFDPPKTAEFGTVLMELSLAHPFLIEGHMTFIKARVGTSMAKKRTGTFAHGKCVIKYYKYVMRALKRHFDVTFLYCVILCNLRYFKEDFCKSIMEQAVRQHDKVLL